MTVCNFFLQGRCRYGDKCWNEHPRGGGGGYNNRSSAPPQQSRGGGGGFGNKVWVNPSQQKGGFYQQQSSHGSDHWGGRGQDVKSSEFSFSSQNRFSALSNTSNFETGGRGGGGGGGREVTVTGEEDDVQKLESIQNDMKTWERSGQWGFSCYCSFKTQLSGFKDVSPEELRLEYYSTKASGDLQSYLNGVNLLLSQWRSRVQELLLMNPATRAALLAELKNPSHQTSSSGFGSPAPGFGSSSFGSKGFGAAPVQASTFSFAAPAGGVGSSAAPTSAPAFGSAISAPTGFGAPSSSSGFGSGAPTAASFAFASPPVNQPAASSSGFGSASGFSFSSTANNNNNKGAFGSGFRSEAPAGSLFGQSSAATGSAGGASDMLFTPQSELTPEELHQFKAQRFTLGQIPLKPPPAEMLRV
ncbi:nucleoporin NUP42 [Festucalex cinctus]